MNIFSRALRSAIQALRGADDKIIVREINIPSQYLVRGVTADVFLPPYYRGSADRYPVLWFNDGQDMLEMGMYDTLTQLYAEGALQKIIVVAVYSNENRMDEYGVVGIPDYKKRGAKATEYMQFVTRELLPFVRADFRMLTDARYNVFAGCSLGGLSAFDIVWENPKIFSKVGAFSASFWWRSTAPTPEHPDANRIVVDKLAVATKKTGLRFWFEVGGLDETEDRNGNGIIDSIDDTRDVIIELVKLGYRPHEEIDYVELDEGEHNQQTWGKVLPNFLEWAFG